MTGLRSLLDDANTGDIRLICLEREERPRNYAGSAASSSTAASPHVRYRKRILHAHSSIIKHRSEYLADWIHFSSSEVAGMSLGASRYPAAGSPDRPTHTVTCLDVDFATMYWFLHFLYTGELEFKDEEDVTENASLDPEVAQELVADVIVGNPWEWRSVSVNEDGTMEVVPSSVSSRMTSENPVGSTRSYLSTTSSRTPSTSTPAQGHVAAGPTERSEGERREFNIQPSPFSASSTTTLQAANLARTRSSPTTPQASTSIRSRPMPDPHAHPTGPMPPASAFAIYALAHRYQLDELSRLAHNHLLANLQPKNSCTLLLSSFRFGQLHVAIEDYVIAHWEAVQGSVRLCRCESSRQGLNCSRHCRVARVSQNHTGYRHGIVSLCGLIPYAQASLILPF